MSRYSPDIDREDIRSSPPGQQTSGRVVAGKFIAELIAIIDQATADKPTMAQLLDGCRPAEAAGSECECPRLNACPMHSGARL